MAMVPFSITGEFMTEHARNLVLDGNMDHALKTLVEGLEGFGYDRAISLLKGDMKLVGNNDLGLVEDDDALYKNRLAEMYSGVFVSNRRYYRPYAVITSWCQDDIIDREKGPKFPIGNSQLIETKFMSTRGNFCRDPRFYADDPYNDIARMASAHIEQYSTSYGGPVGDGVIVLCREIPHFPNLIMPHHGNENVNDAIKALAENGHRLCEYGAGFNYVPDEPVKMVVNDPIKDEIEIHEDKIAKTIDTYRSKIVEQAGDNVFELTYERNGETIVTKVPTAPFENWSLWRTVGAHLATPWNTVSPSGLKMMNDDPYHSDWMIGANIPLGEMSNLDSTLSSVAYEKMYEIQETKLGFKSAVLCGDKSAFGTIFFPKKGESATKDQIIVIPNAGPDYVEAALTAGGVITANGGTMAHLVTVSREHNVTIMRVENATKVFKNGMKVTLNPSKGSVDIEPYSVRDRFGEFSDD